MIQIKILASFFNEKTLITIDDDGVLLVDSKNEVVVEEIEAAYAQALKDYGPSDGFFGKYLAMQLVKCGAKILEVSDTEEEEAKEDGVY
jgi:hypothetical protein